jgi:23S rRNA pseudouridine1911/1915/1917 synthase
MSSAEKIRLRVEESDAGLRLDQYLAARVPGLSRRRARVVLDIGGVFVDRARVKVAGRKVRPGQLVEVVLGGALDRATKKTGKDARRKDAERLPPYRILFEDDDLVVVHKPPGLLTAPTPESDRGNLADLLSRRGRGPVLVVHRIDLDTSGVLVFARSDEANRTLSATFRDHEIEREYLAVVDDAWPDALTLIDEPVQGKSAISHMSVEERLGNDATVLRVRLETGRTHQIRLHCAGAGHPVLGDRQHGGTASLRPPRMALHARLLAFDHPRTGEPMRFESPLPDDLSAWLEGLRSDRAAQGGHTDGS